MGIALWCYSVRPLCLVNWRHLRRQLVSFNGSKDIAHGMYCGFPSPLLTSAHLHGPTSIDHILFCNSSDAFAIILLITSPTPIGRTLPLPLSSGIRQVAKIGSMVSGSSVCTRCSLGVVRMRLYGCRLFVLCCSCSRNWSWCCFGW